jgi:hypothetical protein
MKGKGKILLTAAAVFFAAMMVVFLAGPNCWAGDAEKLMILKTVEGNWNSEIVGQDGKTYVRPWVFKVEGNEFVCTITRPGMSPEEGRVPLSEISEESGTLNANIPFPPYIKKASLKITKGTITGTAWRGGMNPAPSDIVFKRR